MAIACRELEDAQERAWDEFVFAMPHGTFFHRARWRHVISRAFGHHTYYIYAERDGAICGVLPLVHVRTRLFGNGLISIPFGVYGGIVAADSDAADMLRQEVGSLMQRTRARFCELRFLHSPGELWISGPALYETFRKPLASSDEENLRAIPRKQRAVIRKGIANGLVAHFGGDTRGFFRLYSESVRNLGTPVFPRHYFDLLLEVFRDSAEVLTIEDAGRPLSAVLAFVFRNEVLPYYAGGGPDARHRAAHDFMYWELMRRAVVRGLNFFDFGRSKVGTGAHAFKKNWGFTPEALHYRYLLAPGARLPQNNPLNPKYRLLIAAWKRLPLPVANVIGPHIVRGIG